jgi:hypothetical protein
VICIIINFIIWYINLMDKMFIKNKNYR